MRVLVTGGAGYIGSHICLELLEAGHDVTVVDNLANGKREALRRVETLAQRPLELFTADLNHKDDLSAAFAGPGIGAVIHCAGLKAVAESVTEPLRYYANNVAGTVTLCETMQRHGVGRLVFSSSCTVYGDAATVPITEELPPAPVNPYGRTKRMVEQLLADLQGADPAWDITLLRYFNPAGAHASGRIGEDPAGVPDNLFAYIAQVAVGRRPELRVFGNDYPTPDGTGVRDYIHVVDLALAHVRALEAEGEAGLRVYNLGTGRGYSVLEVVDAFESASGRKIPYVIAPRRPGDVARAYADPSKAHAELGWRARRDLHEMCRDAWRWQSRNPDGYPHP